MAIEDNKVLKYNYGGKSLKVPAISYADIQCFLEKMHSYQNNLEKFCREKKAKHILVIQYLQVVRLTQQTTNLIVAKVNIVWKVFVKT